MNSKLINYTQNLSRLKAKIEKLKEYGIEVENFNAKIKSIEDSIITETNVEEIVGGTVVIKRMKVEPAYDDALKSLSDIEKNIDEYKNFLFIKNTIERIKNISYKSIDDKKLYEFKSKIVECINDLNNFEIYNYKTVTDLLEETYECAYKIIKLELVENGDSDIFNYIKEHNKGIEFINTIAKNEAEKVKNSYSYNNIDKYLNTMDLSIDDPYANKDLIFLLACEDSDLKEICSSSIENYKNIKSDSASKIVEIKEASKKLKENAKDIRIDRIKSFLCGLSLTLLLSTGLWNNTEAINSAKTNSMVTAYETSAESYNTFSDKVTNKVIYTTMDRNDVTINYYGKVDEDGNRTYGTYELEKSDLENIKDYSNLGIDSDKLNIINYDEASQITDEEYIEVNRALIVDKSDTKDIVDKKSYAKIYKDKILIYRIIRHIFTIGAGINISTFIGSFFNKKKRRKFFTDESNKSNEEFEIQKSNFEIADNKFNLLKEKKQIADNYPAYYGFETNNEITAKELINEHEVSKETSIKKLIKRRK